MKNIYIIGGGMGNLELLTSEAKNVLRNCEEVFAFDRMAELYQASYPNISKCSYSKLAERIVQSKAKSVGILVSGDIGFYSAAKTIRENFDESCNIINVCGINCLQYLCSKLGLSYENIPVVSLHGRNRYIFGNLSYQRFTFVLTGSDHRAGDILKELSEQGLGHMKATVGEFLSMERERIITGTVAELAGQNFDDLCVILLENPRPVQKDNPLFDEELVRDKVPMTKQEVRWTSLQYLKLQPKDVVYDIGAGTGSVSIELGRRVYEGMVYAIEKKDEAYSLLTKNREKLGAYNVIPSFGSATLQIKMLPVPDKAFIGGSGHDLREILDYLFHINPSIRIVVNAITLETLSSAISILKEQGCQVQVACMNVSNNKEIGGYNLMMANNPVYIIAGERESI